MLKYIKIFELKQLIWNDKIIIQQKKETEIKMLDVASLEKFELLNKLRLVSGANGL